MTLVKETDIRD